MNFITHYLAHLGTRLLFKGADAATTRAAESVADVLYGTHPHDPEIPKVDCSIALQFRKTGNPNEAVRILRDDLKRAPDDYDALMLMATIQAEDCQDLPAAHATIERIVVSEKTTFAQKDYSAAQFEHWRKASGTESGSLLSLDPRGKAVAKIVGTATPADQARQLRLEGRSEEALALLEKALKKKPDSYELLLDMATIAGEDLKDIKRAEMYVARLVSLKYAPSGWKEMVQGRLQDWRDNAAEAPPKLGGQFAPAPKVEQLPVSAVDAARAHRAAGRCGSAIECLEEWLKIKPADFEALMLVAEIYAENLKDLRVVEKTIRRIQGHPNLSAELKDLADQRLRGWRQVFRA
jgi:tetratricopeptide (TPR) repeat protein